MNGKKARLARKLAFDEATRSGLWAKGVEPPRPLWQRIVEALTPWKREARAAAASDRKGRWYRWAIKRMTGQAKAALTDPARMKELEAFQRARAKIQRKHERERARSYFARAAAGDPAKG